jgi:hypothetical protein
LVFVPTAADVYPAGFSTYVEPPAVAQQLHLGRASRMIADGHRHLTDAVPATRHLEQQVRFEFVAVEPVLPEKGIDDSSGLGQTRWPVERTLSWITRHRRTVRDYELPRHRGNSYYPEALVIPS